MTTMNTNLVPGTILLYDIGYSMCLPHFAIIESVTPSGKSVRVREMDTDFISNDCYRQTGYMVPTNPVGKLQTCRIIDDRHVRINGHYAAIWNGKPAVYDSMD